MSKKEHKITFRLDEDLYRFMVEFAAREDMPVSQVVRRMVRTAIYRHLNGIPKDAPG